MVDFNWYRPSTDEDWHVRAARLRAEIYTNNYWYRVITQAVPRYSSDEDAERVSTLLNAHMAASRRMERELAWLEDSLESAGEVERRSVRRTASPPPVNERRKNHDVAIGVTCLFILGPLSSLLEDSLLGNILLLLAFVKLCHFAVGLIANARQWFLELRSARADVRALREMSEPEIIRWSRAVRLHEYQQSAERCVVAE